MEMIAVYVTGGLLYGLIELLWRGWTHWSMLLCGGLCFTLMYAISLSALTFPWKCLLQRLRHNCGRVRHRMFG